ncbi:B12-binding domain-containing radical SAM protein [Streptomyces sp. WI04-05B]|uniref:B12-binding domain-containing radical SAM protein n=1 Tax=Streptomyces TaxID=1883 RepID=UPI0029ABE9F6|nr:MULTISPECIES: radical SAM protein [unclassified Streptomyces]MDX2545383.1 radical SAM protein [Streptomyces sp. WI04-05B]MDX2588122.1 radical SAM protein [Streptomyces sp. WI04-05A]MDX3749117.1 radical SAM protein [Streptomyces sp. AK08-02]
MPTAQTRPTRVMIVVSPGEQPMFTPMNLPPFGTGIVTASLRAAGYDVDLHDLNSDLRRMWLAGEFAKTDLAPFFDERAVLEYVAGGRDDHLEDFADRLLAGKDIAAADVVGVSAGGDFSFLEIQSALVVGAYIKRHFGKPVVLGGNNLDYLMQFKDAFHSWWEAALTYFDAAVTGPGEDVFVDLVASLGDRRPQLPMARPGLARMSGTTVLRSPDAAHRILAPDFDGLRMEDYHNFVLHRPEASARKRETDEQWNRMQLYQYPPYLSWLANETNAAKAGDGVAGKLVMPYVFNYNCPYNCAFCTESLERTKLVHATVDDIVADMAGLSEKYETPYFYLFNNYFNLVNGFLEDFASRVVLHGIELNWSDCARFNSLTYERLELLAASGCRKLTFGLETASTKMLKIIDKRVKLAEAERVLRWCKELGIWADLEIITGLPHEDADTFAETTDFLERNADRINYFNVNRYFVAPKSLMGAKPGEYGMRLRKAPDAYQRLLDANYRWLADDLEFSYKPQNFRVYEFDEIDGRTAEQLAADIVPKIAKLNAIQSTDFSDSWRMLNLRRNRPGQLPARMSNETMALT